MATTPTHNIQYPVLSDTINLPGDLQSMAESTDAAITANGGGGGGNVLVVDDLSNVPPGTPVGTVIVVDPLLVTSLVAPVIAESTNVEYESLVSNDWVLNLPATTQVGDYLVTVLHSQASDYAADVTPPAGWTRLGPAFAVGTSSKRYGAMFGRIADGTEGSSVTFTAPTSGDRKLGCVLRLTGVDTSNPVVASTDLERQGTMATAAFSGGSHLEITHLGSTCAAPNYGTVSTAGAGTTLVETGFAIANDGLQSDDWQHVYQRDVTDGAGGLTWALDGPAVAADHMNVVVFRGL